MIRGHRFRPSVGLTFASFVLLTLAIACDQPATSGPAAPDIRFAAGGNGGGGSITVTGVDPNEVEQGASGLSLRVFGSGFEPGTEVSFELDGKAARKLTTNSTTWVSDTELLANIDVALDADPADYDVIARRGPSKGVGSELLTVNVNPGLGPPDPGPEITLSITFDQTASGPNGSAVTGDSDLDGDGTSDEYVDDVDGTLAILRNNGNLNFYMAEGSRKDPPIRTASIAVYSPETGLSDRGAYAVKTNSNSPCPGDPSCPPGEVDVVLRDMPVSTTAVARTLMGFVWEEDGVEHRLRYGFTCETIWDRIPAERAYVMHPDPDTWIVWGSDATWCSQVIRGNNPRVTVSDDARADFSITIRRLP